MCQSEFIWQWGCHSPGGPIPCRLCPSPPHVQTHWKDCILHFMLSISSFIQGMITPSGIYLQIFSQYSRTVIPHTPQLILLGSSWFSSAPCVLHRLEQLCKWIRMFFVYLECVSREWELVVVVVMVVRRRHGRTRRVRQRSPSPL